MSFDADEQWYICFECDCRWRGPKDSEAESCPDDGCPGYGEPLG